MKNLLSEIESLQKDLNRKQTALAKVISNIKEEMSSSYWEWNHNDGSYFKFALMLMFGEYVKPYENTFINGLEVKQRKDWDTKEYSKYYNLSKVYQTSRYDEYEKLNIGFVCYKQDLYTTILSTRYLHKLWLDQINNHRYTGGWVEFNTLCQSKDYDLYKLVKDFYYNNITTINYPSLDIKDVVVFINK